MIKYSFAAGFLTILLLFTLAAHAAEDKPTYAVLTSPQWAAIDGWFDWAIPRENPTGDTLIVKPEHGPLTAPMIDSLMAAGVDTSTHMLTLQEARTLVATWTDTTEVPE